MELWDVVCFLVFIGLLGYVGLHKKIIAALDNRKARIEADLAEAANLRREAEELLASFVKKKEEAEAEAKAIIAQAESEAELIAQEAHERAAEFVRRRTKQAEEKIASAESQAMAQVRDAAAEAATKAAEIVLKVQAKGALGEDLVEEGIADLKRLLH
ncbi:MAG TPA: ATP F0F1 synthase subunit B [Methylovirgula sp.]|nr:ATP F0F1 synthase subunit B [Methylovirgula sp.]